MRWNCQAFNAVGKLRVMDEDEDSCTVRLRASNQQTWICLTDLNELITNPLDISRCIIISGFSLSVFVHTKK